MFKMNKSNCMIFACIGAALMLNGCSLTGTEDSSTAQAVETLEDRPAVLEVTEDEFVRTLPESLEGRGAIFQLQNEDIATETYIDLSQALLHCSDGVDRTAWAISENAGFISNDAENQETTDGIVSTSDNLSLMGWVAARNGETIGTIMDSVSEQQAKEIDGDGSLMISDTVQVRPNVYLTDYISTGTDIKVETFCILNVLDDETVQMYLLSRTSDPQSNQASRSEENINSDDEENSFLKSFISSDDNRDVFCGVLQSLLQKMN